MSYKFLVTTSNECLCNLSTLVKSSGFISSWISNFAVSLTQSFKFNLSPGFIPISFFVYFREISIIGILFL